MKKFVDYFIKGLVVFVPIALTIFLLIWVFTSLGGVFRNILPDYIPLGLGIVLTIGLIVLIGFVASNYLGKKLIGFIEKVFTGLPLVKLLYSAVKDMTEAFAGEKKSFDKPVLASISLPGAKSGPTTKVVGFITKESLDNFGLADYVAVYVPQSYNFAGNVLLFPKASVQPLAIESSQAMAFIVSGGVSGGAS
jgi:uncharacterized membrane protein